MPRRPVASPEAPSVSYRITAARRAGGSRLVPTGEQEQVLANTARRLRLLAGPGTGKTATLVETVAHRVESGACRPEDVLVLTFSRRAAAELGDRIVSRLARTTSQPMVRTIHGYAYSLVRAQAAAAGQPSPRLLGAGESDLMVRELLVGHAERGGGPWPDHLRGALTSSTFAAELRDLLMRAAELGLDPRQLTALGRRHKRADWVAVGRFALEYQQVSDLRQGSVGLGQAFDQAELTVAALGVLADPQVLAQQQRRIRRLYVDEYQDVDPAQAKLIEVLASGADELIVVGDPDQSIYAFRGSDPAALRDIEVDRTVALTLSRRMASGVLTASRRIAQALPGPNLHRELTSADLGPGDVRVAVLPSGAQEAAYLADQLRRAHLFDGVPWHRMAVLLRSPAAGVSALSRAFALAGVPMVVGRSDQPLSADPLVVALLSVMQCGVDPAMLTGQLAVDLLTSPLGGMDGMSVRRLRRAIRSADPNGPTSADVLASVLAGAPPPRAIPADLEPPVTRLAALVELARARAAAPVAEDLLWALWQAADLQPALVAAVERGGRAGQQADRRLDAVVALFELAADLADRLPSAGVAAFVSLAREQQLPVDVSAPAQQTEAVAVLSAHAAKGLEWDVVAIHGVQEGSWPDLRPRGSLLGTDELIEAARGLPAGTSRIAAALAEERRLFYVAVTRARHTVICTAVVGEEQTPSRFLAELTGSDAEPEALPPISLMDPHRRHLHLVDLVASLRRALTDPASSPDTVDRAAAHLRQLAEAGVRGAHPRDWFGLPELSSLEPAVPDGMPVRVSPSNVEALTRCPLRAVTERRAGRGEPGQPQIEGIVVHALAHGLALGVPEAQLRAEIDGFVARQEQLPPWMRERTLRVLSAMLRAARAWVTASHPPRRLVGSELDLTVAVPRTAESTRPVRLAGRLDWLSMNPDGSLVVTDFKTAASVPSKADVQANPQLAAYQLAVELGAFDEQTEGVPARPGGAELVFLRSGTAKVIPQDPLNATEGIIATVRAAAEQLAAARVVAVENSRCPRCPVRSSCPVQLDGAQVTR